MTHILVPMLIDDINDNTQHDTLIINIIKDIRFYINIQ